MLTPLHGFLAGDTMGVLVLVHAEELVGVIAERLMQAATMRVAPFSPAEVVCRGRVLDPTRPIGESGITALDRIDVRPARAHTGSSRRPNPHGPHGPRDPKAWR